MGLSITAVCTVPDQRNEHRIQVILSLSLSLHLSTYPLSLYLSTDLPIDIYL